jgi:hypothetical protein
VLAAVGLVYGSLLAFRAPDVRGVIAYSSLAQMGLITLGLFATNDLGFNGAVLQMVNHGLISATLFLLAGAIERRTATGEFLLLGGMARGRPALATLLMTTGVIALAVPGSERVRRRVPRARRRVPAVLALRRRRRGRDRARRDVHAPPHLRRAAPGRRLGRVGRGPDLVPASWRSSCRSWPACSRCPCGPRDLEHSFPRRRALDERAGRFTPPRRPRSRTARCRPRVGTPVKIETPNVDWLTLSPELSLLALRPSA